MKISSFFLISSFLLISSVLKAQVNIDSLNYALIIAADEGNADDVKSLLEKGASVDAVSDNSVSALMYASQNGHLKCVQILVANGAHIEYHTVWLNGALYAACANNNFYVAEYLLQKGASPSLPGVQKETPLHVAARSGFFEIADMLLFFNASVNAPDMNGNSPLMCAVYGSQLEIAEMIVMRGGDINYADMRGFTPVMVAAQNGDTTMLNMLTSSGATLKSKNDDGFTAVEIAIISGKEPSFNWLMQRGDSLVNKKRSAPVRLAYLTGNRKMAKSLRKSGFRNYLLPQYGGYALSFGGEGNNRDFMFRTGAKLIDNRFGLSLTFDYATRFWAVRTLYEVDDMQIQYWERRSWIAAGIEKRFILKKEDFREKGFFVGADAMRTYGKLRGTVDDVETKTVLIPEIGYYLRGGGVGLSLFYRYYGKFTSDIPAHRLGITLDFFGNRNIRSMNQKTITW